MALTAYRYWLRFLLMLLSMAMLVAPVRAQTAPDPPVASSDNVFLDEPLDPDQPLADFPDFGVDWPDLDYAESGPANAVAEGITTDPADETSQEAAPEPSVVAGEEPLPEIQDDNVFRIDDGLAERGYRVLFSGLPETLGDQFDDRFAILSTLRQYRRDGANFAQIKRRAEQDRDLVEQLLRIDGYYDAVVRVRYENRADGNINVIIAVIAGPQYRLDDIGLPGVETAREDDRDRLSATFGLQTGDIVNSDEIISGRTRLETALAESGYAFAQVDEPELVIDHAERQGDLSMPVEPGGRYAFGSIIMGGEPLFDADHVQMIARFDPGDLYRQSDVEDLRRALIATGLLSTVTLDPVVSQEPETVDLAVNVTAAPLRTISGAVGYGTGEGARLELSWEHRNFFPPEGLVRLTGVAATQEQSGSIAFRRNNFRRRDNVLNGRVALSNINRPAFEAQTFSVSANIERQSNLIFQKKWSWSVGVELLASRENDITGPAGGLGSDTFFIGSLPALLTYDASDDLLDPTRGFRLSARVAPEASLQDGSFFYVRGQVDGSAYVSVSPNVVVAARARIGSIVGAGNNRIAPSRRLYAGGGGSIRGYGFQQIGPRDINNDPVGGRSLVEFSLESRIRTGLFDGNLGFVPFVDAGNVYTSSTPDFTGIRFGAGLGLRYYSDFGPIRVDVGTPINRQPGDSRIAVYVSLGQAF